MKAQKDEVLQVIRELRRHMTAEDIYLACHAKGMSISMATVYRNLGIMAENKVIRKVSVPGRPDYYDFTVKDHGHKICDICGRLSDADLGDLKADFEKKLGMKITDYDLCLHYICPECRSKQGRNLL